MHYYVVVNKTQPTLAYLLKRIIDNLINGDASAMLLILDRMNKCFFFSKVFLGIWLF